MILTPENYYSKGNTFITNSRLAKFQASKALYKKIFVDGHKPHLTAAMKIGVCVDTMVCRQANVPYRLPFEISVLKRDDPEAFERQKLMDDNDLITAAQFDEALARANAIKSQPFFADWARHGAVFQPIYQAVVPFNGRTLAVAGRPDVVTDLGDIVYIDDVKSVSAAKVKSDAAWFWNCEDMNYIRQGSVYTRLWRLMNPDRKDTKVVFRHAVVYNVGEDIFRVRLFTVPETYLANGWQEFLGAAMELHDAIASGDLNDPPVTWDGATVLERPQRLDPAALIGDDEE